MGGTSLVASGLCRRQVSKEAQEEELYLWRQPWGLRRGLRPVSRQWGGWNGETGARAGVPSREREGPVERPHPPSLGGQGTTRLCRPVSRSQCG